MMPPSPDAEDDLLLQGLACRRGFRPSWSSQHRSSWPRPAALRIGRMRVVLVTLPSSAGNLTLRTSLIVCGRLLDFLRCLGILVCGARSTLAYAGLGLLGRRHPL